METQTLRIFKFVLVPLLVATILTFYYDHQGQRDFDLHIDFYDIGQGDALMITTAEGNQIVVDGGPGSSVLEGVGHDMPFFDRTIEMVVMTHPHADHLDGLIPIMRRYQVKKVLVPNIDYHSSEYDEFLAEAAKQHSEIIYAIQGERIWLDRSTVFDVMYPDSVEKIKPGKNDDLNQVSIVGRLLFGKTKILLTGDSGAEIEANLLAKFNLDSDLLKVGHHGSKYSTSQPFVDEVTPAFSVISSGENNYGHPDPGIIDRLKAAGSQVLRTDQLGDIEFRSDGTKLYQAK